MGNWRSRARTEVSLVNGSYFKSLPDGSAVKTSCMKFLKSVSDLLNVCSPERENTAEYDEILIEITDHTSEKFGKI